MQDLSELIRNVNDSLIKIYGNPEWISRADPIDELIYTIISQNTADINTIRAFRNLKEKFLSWEEVRDAPESKIAEVIHTAGLHHIKARRIKEVLQEISNHSELRIDFLKNMNDDAKKWLRSLKGVGPKTAACVLLFSLGMPALPIDTHVYRVSVRLGLIPYKTSLDDAHEILEKAIEKEIIYAFHINMIKHGRSVCLARSPKCQICELKFICRYFKYNHYKS